MLHWWLPSKVLNLAQCYQAAVERKPQNTIRKSLSRIRWSRCRVVWSSPARPSNAQFLRLLASASLHRGCHEQHFILYQCYIQGKRNAVVSASDTKLLSFALPAPFFYGRDLLVASKIGTRTVVFCNGLASQLRPTLLYPPR